MVQPMHQLFLLLLPQFMPVPLMMRPIIFLQSRFRFWNTPSDEAGVEFKDGNSDNTDPDYKVDYNSPYILSWTDTQIKLNVPDRAGTGKFAVVLNDGTE
jgi:hypothetical protein